MREIVVYGETVRVSEQNQRVFKSLHEEYDIPEEVLATIWGYISQAILDCKDASERAYRTVERRVSAKNIFEEYGFLLTRYSNRLDEVLGILPELGCRAATPEDLETELKRLEI